MECFVPVLGDKDPAGYQPYRDDPLVDQEKIRWKQCVPYNFLNHIAGDGTLLVGAKSLGWYASIPHHLGDYDEDSLRKKP